jgi:hypothetical protein
LYKDENLAVVVVGALVELLFVVVLVLKAKEIPSQAWTDPDGSRILRFPDFKTIGT